jgi:hypothetical protein
MIPVTKTFLPPRQEYEKYLQQIWKTGWVTNNGELATGLEEKLEDYLGVPHLQLLSSGTIFPSSKPGPLEIVGRIPFFRRKIWAALGMAA